jgi:hypothetical protein
MNPHVRIVTRPAWGQGNNYRSPEFT